LLNHSILSERPVFVSFVTAGFPSPEEAVDILLALEQGGSDIIEFGEDKGVRSEQLG
jgi:tryptophan synthase alpha subunit